MNVPLFLLERWLPGWVRRRMLGELTSLTADAFGTPVPRPGGRGKQEAIASFAAFTRREVERIASGESTVAAEAVRARLHAGAQETGRRVRRQLGITSESEALRALRLLYRGIGITLNIDPRNGDLSVPACAFSRVYPPAVCAFISALDAGLVDGLTGGRTLVFTARITEGAPCCRATLTAAPDAVRVGARS